MTKINYIGKCLLIEQDEVDRKGKIKRILVVGDLHFGYGESMRQAGILVPDVMYDQAVRDIDGIFDYIGKEYGGIDEVVLLGDLKHEFGRILDAEWREIKNFIDHLMEKLGKDGKIVIIKGNHDPITEIVTEKRGLELKDYHIIGDAAFVHGDRKLEESEIYDNKVKYWIMGHGHPAVRISDGVKEEKYKCFLVGGYRAKREEMGERIRRGILGNDRKEIIIVPSFFSVNEGTDVRDFDLGMAWEFDLLKFDVKIVAENTDKRDFEVLDFGKLERLQI